MRQSVSGRSRERSEPKSFSRQFGRGTAAKLQGEGSPSLPHRPEAL